MVIRRWVLAPVLAALVASAAVSFSPALAQQQIQPKAPKLDKAQQAEVQAAYAMVDAIAAGQAVPNDIGMSLRTDYLKAVNGLTFVPFVLSIDPAQVPASKSVILYLRLVARTPAVAPAAKDKAPAKAPEFAFQGVHFIELRTPAPGEPYRVTRAFSVPAGEYDLYVLLRERSAAGKDKAAGPKAGYLRQLVTVPDLWTNELTTSSVIVAEDLKPLDRPATADQISEQPYTIGANVVTPASSSRMSKKGELQVVYLVYNTGQDGQRKPDVAVEYGFYQKTADKTEKFFNKTQPQMFNAATLPAQFDLAAGHNLLATQAIPLASFPEGEYRLEIKITDKLSGKVITRNVLFSVVP